MTFLFPLICFNHNQIRSYLCDGTAALCSYNSTRVHSCPVFHTCTHQWRICPQEGHSLPLHIGTHQSPVGIVILQKGNQGRCHRDDLLGRHVHEINFLSRDQKNLVFVSGRDLLVYKSSIISTGLVGLGNDKFILPICCEVFDLICNSASYHFPVRRLNKTKLVHSRKRAHGADEADIGALRGLNGAHSAIVGVMYVSHFKTSPLAAKATGA